MENIKVSISGADEPVSTVRVDGVVDTLTAGEVDRAIDGLLRQNRSRIVLDLAGVEYISSAGWGAFISHLKEARDNQGDVRLCGMIPNVREIYELLEFDTVLTSYPSVSQALGSFEVKSRPPEGGPRAPESSEQGLEELTAIGVDAPFAETMTVVGTGQAPAVVDGARRADSPEQYLLELVAADPFASIGELKRELNESGRYDSVSWWWAYICLRRNDLLSKRARFHLARRKLRN